MVRVVTEQSTALDTLQEVAQCSGEQSNAVDFYDLLRALLAALPVFLRFVFDRPFVVHARPGRFRVLVFLSAIVITHPF